jgi:hypothetical protein
MADYCDLGRLWHVNLLFDCRVSIRWVSVGAWFVLNSAISFVEESIYCSVYM